MDTWKSVAIGDLFDTTIVGEWGTPPTMFSSIPVLRSTNMTDDGRLDVREVVLRSLAPEKLQPRRISKGDILIEKSGGGPQQPAGRVAFCGMDFDGTCSNFVEIARVKSAYNSKFVFYLLHHLYRSGLVLRYQQQTTGIINFKFNEYKAEVVRVPILRSEQTAIADILTTVDRAIEQTEALIAKQRRIKAGLLHDLLTRGIDEHGHLRDPSTHRFKPSPVGLVPEEWEVKPLTDLAEIGSGVTLGRTISGPDTIELPYLRVANVQDGYIDLSEVKKIRVYHQEVPRFLLQSGDVLMAEGGDYDKLGRGTVWRGQISPCLHQNHVFRVRTERAMLLPDFLALVSASAYGKRFFVLSSKQSTNLASINSTQLKAFPVPLPSAAEQASIVKVLDASDLVMETEGARLAKLQRLKTGLMQDLLSGRVSVAGLVKKETHLTSVV